MTSLQEKFVKETGTIPIFYNDEHYQTVVYEYVEWLEKQVEEAYKEGYHNGALRQCRIYK